MTPFGKLASALTLALSLVLPGAANAYHQGDTLKLNFGSFTIHGSYTKRSCSGQTNLTSKRGLPVSASVYWTVGKNLYLLASHPEVSKVKGRQTVKFNFPDGRKITFPMKRHGDLLQVPVGIGPRGITFYDALMANPHVTVELTGVDDSILVDLIDKDKAEAGALYCKAWLHE